MKSRVSIIAPVLLGVALLLAACGNDSAGQDAGTDGAAGQNVLDVFTGGYPDSINACYGKATLSPVLIQNTAGEDITFTWSPQGDTTNQFGVWQASEVQNASCDSFQGFTEGGTSTVPANSTQLLYFSAGGNTYAGGGQILIGANSQGNQFVFNLNLSGLTYGFESFTLDLPYVNSQDPGIVGATAMGPGMLNVQNCVENDGQVAVGQESLASFYADSGANTTWGMNQPICFYVTGD